MLINILFMTAWLCLPLLWNYLLRAASLSLSQLSIPTITIAFIYLFQYIGLPILYFGLDEFRRQLVTDQDAVLLTWGLTSITITLMIFGFIAAHHQFGRLDLFMRAAAQLPKKSNQSIIAATLLAGCIGVLLIYINNIGLDKLAIFVALGDEDVGEINQARSIMGTDFQGRYYLFRIFMQDGLLFFSLYYFGLYLQQPNKNRFVMFFLVIILTTVGLLIDTQKSPVVYLYIALFLVYSSLRLSGNLPTSFILKSIISIFIFLLIFYVFILGVEEVDRAATSIISRSITGQLEDAYHYLEFFPKHHDYLFGTSFPNPGGIFPYEPYRLTFEIKNFVNPSLWHNGIVGSAPTIFWAELYANFGYMGALSLPFVVGYLLYAVNSWVFSMEKNYISVAFFSWIAIHYSKLAITGISNFIIDPSLVFMALIALSLQHFHRIKFG